MPKGSDSVYLPDGSFDWSGGVDSSLITTLKSALNPGGLARSQTAWIFNGTVRGGGILQRTGFLPLLKLLPGGRWQGCFVYEPDSANPYLVFQVDGVLYSALLEPPYTVRDLTGGNPVLRNPPNAEVAWFVQGEQYAVIQAGDFFTGPVSITVNSYGQPLISPSTTLPLFWDGTILRRSSGITTVAPAGYLPGINEIPAATCMDYFAGRLWYAQARQYSAGDMVGGPSGTAINHYRDSILSITENPLVLGGDGFTVPTNAGNIRAIKHSANLNATLGEGNLYIFTRKTIYSLAVPVTRTDWIAADSKNQPLQTVVQIFNGAVGDRSVVTVNGDLFYQALEPSIRSLQVSVRNFGQWGNLPISQNEQRALQINDRGLMRFSSGINFDNRMLQLCLPVLAADGVNVVHQAILPLDFDVVSNLSTQGPTNVSGTSAITPPVWEGAYDGLQFLQLFEGDFGGLHRGFSAVISEVDGSINIWELTTSSRTDANDNRVLWGAEFPAFTWATAGLETKLKQLKGGELWIDKVFGTVDIDVWYREDADPCWRFWLHTQICAARGCSEAEPVCTDTYPPTPFREGYRWPIVFPEPKPACDSMGVRPTTIGYQFQTKVMLKGWCRIRGLILYALPHTEPQYHGIACTTNIPIAKALPAPPTPIPPPAPPCVLPVKAIAVSPANGAAGVDPSMVVLNWTDGGGSTSYNVIFNGVFHSNVSTPSLLIGALSDTTPYTWRIDSVNTCGTTTGDTWSFTTSITVIDPTAIAPLAWWLKSDHAFISDINRTNPVDGGNVGIWQNASTLVDNLNYIQSIGQPAVYRATAGPSGHPVVQSAGVANSKIMTVIAGLGMTPLANPWTIFLTFKFAVAPTTDMILDTVSATNCCRFHWNSGAPYFALGGAPLFIPVWDAFTAWARVAIQVNGTGANNCLVRVNGAQVALGTLANVPPNTNDLNDILLGGDVKDTCCWSNIYYHELLFYRGALTLAEIQQVEQYQLNRINGLQ